MSNGQTAFYSGSSKHVQIGKENRNEQVCFGTRGKLGNAPNQKAFKMRCGRNPCDHVYGANGCDVFQRLCPNCQKGAEGIDY